MINHAIEYKSIIMRCDKIDVSAFLDLDSSLEIEFYKNGMEAVWVAIQKYAFTSAADSSANSPAFF